ncbi:hypothetical protein [Devosia sp. SL43]|uniref:hypothetical protein n=1 Tax=Devosia sp. SL43 TaxID=2806348 RepID=UPI001F2C8F9F|nr:hypothetical protein [Devosia sp. SL43]UJW85994.1 hypothetical protein IM737_01510 [Devosia sp. SL43]
MKAISRGIAAVAAVLVMATGAQASEGLMCEGKGATVDVALGRLVIVGVLGAYVEVGGNSYSTGPERGEGIPIITGQAFGDDDGIKIDFVDSNVEEILVKVRLTYTGNEDEPLAGTVTAGDVTADIACMAG